jgi:hypothetical protein
MSAHWIKNSKTSPFYHLETVETQENLYGFVFFAEEFEEHKEGFYLSGSNVGKGDRIEDDIYLDSTWPKAKKKAEKLLKEYWMGKKLKADTFLKHLSEIERKVTIK